MSDVAPFHLTRIMTTYRQLFPGEPAPWFRQRSTSNSQYVFDTAAGRYIVLSFFGSARDEAGRAALNFAQTHRALFDDNGFAFFGVSFDPEDESTGRVQQSLPGIRHFWDFDGTVCRLFGALPLERGTAAESLHRIWVVLDPGLHVVTVLPFKQDGSDRLELARIVAGLPPVSHYCGIEMHAPILILPNVLEPGLCQHLIALYNQHGGEASGFMREINGKTVVVSDPLHKMRDDYTIENDELRKLLERRIRQKVIPAIKQVHSFEVSRIERYIVGCYDSTNGGHFRAHRDNTTKGTAHRRFALSVNLNNAFKGGELSFPEYGPRSYKPPAGSAIIFSGSLLHTVSPVLEGRRYAFLPFMYDEAAALLREKNNPHLAPNVSEYHANSDS